MAKHLIDLDENALATARAALGTSTMRDTVNHALRAAATAHVDALGAALAALGAVEFADREDAWR